MRHGLRALPGHPGRRRHRVLRGRGSRPRTVEAGPSPRPSPRRRGEGELGSAPNDTRSIMLAVATAFSRPVYGERDRVRGFGCTGVDLMPRRRDREHSSGSRAPGQRQLRVGEELRHLLAELLRPGELRDPALRDANITVTEVRLSPDLRNATAFVMPLGGAKADELMAGLRRSAPFLKARLARMVELRHVPNIA